MNDKWFNIDPSTELWNSSIIIFGGCKQRPIFQYSRAYMPETMALLNCDQTTNYTKHHNFVVNKYFGRQLSDLLQMRPILCTLGINIQSTRFLFYSEQTPIESSRISQQIFWFKFLRHPSGGNSFSTINCIHRLFNHVTSCLALSKYRHSFRGSPASSLWINIRLLLQTGTTVYE